MSSNEKFYILHYYDVRIGELKNVYMTPYYLNHETMFQRRSAVSVLQLIRKKWGYVLSLSLP